MLSDDTLYQGNNSRIFYGLGFKSRLNKTASGYFIFDAKIFPETSLDREYTIFAISLGASNQLPLTDKIYSQMRFMDGVTNYSIPANVGGAVSETSFSWEGSLGLVHQMSEKVALEFNVGYLKSQASPVSGFILQTGLVYQLRKKEEIPKLNIK